jgi:ubiquinone/menaquinone biosynthesis C-methylase UbiE
VREHPIFARVYERLALACDRAGERDHRIEMAGGAAGRVLEVGAGTGLNFEHYGKGSTVTALEPDPTMLRFAGERAARAPVPVRLARGVAEALPFPDDAFDTVVVSLALCSVRYPHQVAGEMHRVLRRDGELRFLEHVRSPSPRWAMVQDLVTPLWSMFSGGCHPNRDTVAALQEAGFVVTSRRFPFGPPSPARPHVLGTARTNP